MLTSAKRNDILRFVAEGNTLQQVKQKCKLQRKLNVDCRVSCEKSC